LPFFATYTGDIYKIMQQILLRENKIGRGKEHFWVVCLSHIDRIMLIELLGLGTENSTVVDPTEVFSFALQKLAKKLIIELWDNFGRQLWERCVPCVKKSSGSIGGHFSILDKTEPPWFNFLFV
jgi:hypothetical protein